VIVYSVCQICRKLICKKSDLDTVDNLHYVYVTDVVVADANLPNVYTLVNV